MIDGILNSKLNIKLNSILILYKYNIKRKYNSLRTIYINCYTLYLLKS